jgi:hypothetical protein
MKKFVNLLPSDEQKEYKLQLIHTELWSFGFWLGLSFLILAVLIFAAQTFLQEELKISQQRVQTEQIAFNKLQEQGIQKAAGDFNLNLTNFRTLSARHQNLSPVLIEFARLLPAGLTVDSLTISRSSLKVEASGRASDRKSVLQLRQNLLASSYFNNVNFPLLNLEKRTDAVWKFRFYIRPEILN